MDTPLELVSVTVEGKGGTVRVFIPEADAPRLANATGCVVRMERVYAPAPSVTMAPRPKGSTVEGSIPGRILQQMNAEPTRNFKAADLRGLGIDPKRIGSVLFRLASQGKVERMGPGAFRVRRGSTATANGAAASGNLAPVGATSQANVMAFMRKHPRTSFRPAEVANGMGLSSEFRPSIRSSLKRLAGKGDLSHAGGQFTLGEEGAT